MAIKDFIKKIVQGKNYTPKSYAPTNQKQAIGPAPKGSEFVLTPKGNQVTQPNTIAAQKKIENNNLYNDLIAQQNASVLVPKVYNPNAGSPTTYTDSSNKANAPKINTVVPVPDSAGEVVNTSGVNLGSSTQSSGNTFGSTASVAGVEVGNDLNIGNLDKQNEAQTEQDRLKQENQSFFDKLTGTNEQSTAQTRQDYEKLYDTKSQIAEIKSLQDQYDALNSQMMEDINAQINNYQTTGSVTRQQAAIEQRYAPKMALLSAQVNSRTALLTDSRDAINQAVQDATADKKFAWEQISYFIENNREDIAKLDKRDQDLLDRAHDERREDYLNAVKRSQDVADWMMDNPELARKAGITTLDSPQSAADKVAAVGGTLNVTNSFMDIMQEAINAGATPALAAREAALASENAGIQVDQKTLNEWTDQAMKLVPSTPLETVQEGNAVPGRPVSDYVPTIFGINQTAAFFENLFGD